ncbi:MAG: YHS domain-containing (seleno)protein [Flavitalea sp.]
MSLTAQSENRVKIFNVSDKQIAIQGYDPVAYFNKGMAEKGKSEFSSTYQGITYYFTSQANKSIFLLNPVKYEPQYGGWCAYAMGATGGKVVVDPKTFKIVNGHLFLFYNKYFNNTLKSWNEDEKNLHAKADKNWEKLLKKK